MKRPFMTTAMLPIACLALFISIFSCQKNNTKDIEKIPATAYSNPKIIRYLSITLNMPADSIKIDNTNKEFFIPNTVYRKKISEVEADYANANIYKLTYEKN